MLNLDDIEVRFRVGGGLARRPRYVHAVNQVSLEVPRGSALGIVGESGCGKSTLARAICGLAPLSAGRLALDGVDLDEQRDQAAKRRIQMVFQDPTASLNPRLRIRSVLRELMGVHGLHEGTDADRRAAELMELVGLPATALDKWPREFSGGQRQRIGIARALCVDPDVLIADEAVSALDMTTQAVIIDLLDRLRIDLGITLIFISHDLGVVRAVCDDVAVMYLGRIVEHGPTDMIFAEPRHPYTQMLLASAPRINDVRRPGTNRPSGEPPSPLDPPLGCAFHPRCPIAVEQCSIDLPDLIGQDRRALACHVVNARQGGSGL